MEESVRPSNPSGVLGPTEQDSSVDETPVETIDTQEAAPATEDGPVEDAFTNFDVKTLEGNPEGMAMYKQFQGDYTRKTQAIAEQRKSIEAEAQKVEAYNAFMANPTGMMQSMAAQYGYNLTPQQAAAAAETVAQNWSPDSGQDPETWNDVGQYMQSVAQKTREDTIREMAGHLQPIVGQVQNVQRDKIEGMLNEKAPDWKNYEGEMTAMLSKHPSLAKDPLMLYEMSIPPSVRESRATKLALAQLEGKVNGSRNAGVSTKRTQPEGIDQKRSWDEAVAFAMESAGKRHLG